MDSEEAAFVQLYLLLLCGGARRGVWGGGVCLALCGYWFAVRCPPQVLAVFTLRVGVERDFLAPKLSTTEAPEADELPVLRSATDNCSVVLTLHTTRDEYPRVAVSA